MAGKKGGQQVGCGRLGLSLNYHMLQLRRQFKTSHRVLYVNPWRRLAVSTIERNLNHRADCPAINDRSSLSSRSGVPTLLAICPNAQTATGSLPRGSSAAKGVARNWVR